MASSKPGKDVEMNDENLGKIIEVFKPFLLETLRVSHLLCLLHIQVVIDVAPMVHMKENSGDFQGASGLLLDAISRSEEPGKWRMFVDALREVEDTLILDTLLEENDLPDDGWLDNLDNRALINLFSQDIELNLNLENLLPKMVDAHLIMADDQPRLLAMLHEKGHRQANAMLLMLMHRHDSKWFENFLTILFDDEHHRELAKKIDPGFCNKKIVQKRAPQAVESQGDSQSQEGSRGVSSASRPSPSRQQSAIKAPSRMGQEVSSSLTLNMGAHAGVGEKGMGDKSVPHRTLGSACEPSPATDQTLTPRTSCACGCCAQLLSEVRSLRAEQAEMKTFQQTQIKALQSELSEMKALLQLALGSLGPENGIGKDK